MNSNTNQDFEYFCQNYLNNEQRAVVLPEKGTMVVHAGAGSGKTRVITARIASLLLQYTIPGYQILALTFTNKAAREMKERVAQFLGARAVSLPFVGTFHAYCVRLLRLYKESSPYGEFTILDEDDKEKLIKSLLTRYGAQKRVTPRAVTSLISSLKNNALNGLLNYADIADHFLRELVQCYEREKELSRCLDFDDLLLYTLRLFKTVPEIKQNHQKLVRHILVDEYQDTNLVQHALLQEMAFDQDKKNNLDSLCVVGDEDQSIYSWRGAQAGSMLRFRSDFHPVTAHSLEHNYRSRQPILDVANQVIKHNIQRMPKQLWSSRAGIDCVRLVTCVSGYQEGELVAQLGKVCAQKATLKDLAVLYRSHYQSRALEEALIRNSVPYIIIGGIQFYDRQEIKDLLGYLKLFSNPFDRISWSRVINTPARGLGDKFQEEFLALWDEHPELSCHGMAQRATELGMRLGMIKQESLDRFTQLFESLSRAEKSSIDGILGPSQVLELIVSAVRYENYLQESYDDTEARERFGNIKELISAARSREQQGVITCAAFLEEVALLQEHKSQLIDDRDCVRLMTLHAAKGLEFNTVVLAGLEEGLLPSAHAIINADSIEEERRLLYVGITRAQEKLVITQARYRHTYGQLQEQLPSRFCRELLTSDRVGRYDISQANLAQVQQMIYSWLVSSHEDKSEAIYTRVPSHESEITKDMGISAARKSTETSLMGLRQSERSARGLWRINQLVQHTQFGQGVIEKVETKETGAVYLTIRFGPAGIKKLAADFVQPADN